ncbi:DUF2839 domain-containing protein [Anthocerotibacter panamensis]|uniref:DUF2839 domain-containing protein n=1 Tax=Anthocerotibacter panamensis TaxID=2857077 RepID=UPI001C4020E2|nr:DUF2839 domain-containing protein [Anthocerotibacter panamensis]
MGESKRRKETMGNSYSDPAQKVVFLGFTRAQVDKVYDFTRTGTWICIGALAAFWVVFRIGIWQGWWGKG